MNISSRFSGSAAIFGGIVWVVSDLLQSQTAEGNRAVLGLTEGNYRAILNPALLLIALGLFGLYRVHKSRLNTLGLIGFWVTGMSLTAWLIGNVLEYGLFGVFWLVVGWIVVIVAILGISIGQVLLGFEFLKAKLLAPWSRSLPIIMGALSLAGFFIRNPGMFFFYFGIGWILLGYALWSYETVLSGNPAHQSTE